MEFFERAHVVKNKDSAQKDSKSEAIVKKQLKQMLHGYKQSDNELIKNSANLKNDFDDSSSVSCFSDLNLTNSSIEDNILQETVCSDGNNLSNFNELSLDKSPDSLNIDSDDQFNQNDSVSVSIESISEPIEDNRTLSDDMLQEINDNSSLGDQSSENTMNSSVLQSFDSDTDSSESFDVDGALAARILERLGKAENVSIKERKAKQGRKRKLSKECSNGGESLKNPKDTKNEDLDEVDNCDSFVALNVKEYRGPMRPQESDSDLSMDDDQFMTSEGDLSEQNSIDDVVDQSPQFISITAMDMQTQSLDEVLGDYKHPTMRNLPSDSQNVCTVNNSGLFSSEDLSLNDLLLEEYVDSLEPEGANNVPGDANLDSSVQTAGETTFNDDTLQSEEINERESSMESTEATLINPVKVYYGKNNCIFVLKHPAEIYIHGKVKAQSLGGTIEILGYSLQEEPCNVYAPNYNYAQYMRTVEKENAYYGLFGKLTSAGITVSEAEDIVVTLGEYDGVIILEPLRSRKMDFVDNNFTLTDLFSKINRNVENCFKKASEFLDCTLYLSKPWKCFHENASWNQAISCGLESQSRGIVCGGKGAGKSTFLRYYVNKLLANGPALLIDLDPGQCELTVAGNVSATVVTEPLLGPNFTHLKTPDIMLNLGMINPMDNPRRYGNAVETLLAQCSSDKRLSQLPWIINTMGMTNAMGLKFMILVILLSKPTFLLQIDVKTAKKRFDYHLHSNTIKQLYSEDYQHDKLFRNVTGVENIDYLFFISHNMDGMVKNQYSLVPRDERYLHFLAYFGELLNERNESLLGVVPYEVSLKDLSIGSNVKINEEALTKVINGKVVALCHNARDSKVFALGDKPLRCLGHGLIRGIDWEKEVLFVITPTPGDSLAAVNTLVYADWVPELRGQESHLPPGTAVPYRTASRYQQRQLMFSPKRRFNPLQLLKMSRSS